MPNHSWTITLKNDKRLLKLQELVFYSLLGDVSRNIQSWPSCGRLYSIPKGAGSSASHRWMAIPEFQCRESHGRSMFIISRPSSSIEPRFVGSLRTLHDLHSQDKLAIDLPRSCLTQGQQVLPTLTRDVVGVLALNRGPFNSFPISS